MSTRPEQWVIVKESTITFGNERPQLAYLFLSPTIAYGTSREALDEVRKKNLPLGWVICELSQLVTNKIESYSPPLEQICSTCGGKYVGNRCPKSSCNRIG